MGRAAAGCPVGAARRPAPTPGCRHLGAHLGVELRGRPAGLAVAERTLGLLADGGFDDQAVAELGRLLLSSVVMLVTTEPGGLSSSFEDHEQLLRHKRAALSLLSPKQLPHVVRVADKLIDCDAGEFDARGVDLLVGGIRALLPALRP